MTSYVEALKSGVLPKTNTEYSDDIAEILRDIRRLLSPPTHVQMTPKKVTSDKTWQEIVKLRSDTLIWTVHNLSDSETVLIAFTNFPDENAWIEVAPKQQISRTTRPEYIMAKRVSGTSGPPYPVIMVEEWYP